MNKITACLEIMNISWLNGVKAVGKPMTKKITDSDLKISLEEADLELTKERKILLSNREDVRMMTYLIWMIEICWLFKLYFQISQNLARWLAYY